MRIIRAADYRRMRWKNGGGETIEIAVSPPDSSLDDFHWRVSMAHVASAGPFSHFTGVDRSLAVIAGDGIVLRLGGRGEVKLTHAAAPFAFPGDLPVDAKLVLVRGSGAKLRCGRQRETVADGDTIVLDEAERTKVEIVPDRAAELLVVDFWRG
jgi:hypothetical protein